MSDAIKGMEGAGREGSGISWPLGLASAYGLSMLAVFLPRTAGRMALRVRLWAAAGVFLVNLAAMLPLINKAARYEGVGFALLHPRTAMVTALLGSCVMLFFAVLPFVPRPGANRACVGHVARGVMLATTRIYVWIGAYWGLYWWMTRPAPVRPVRLDTLPDQLFSIMGLGGLLVLHTLWGTVRSVRQEYRKPKDHPGPREPRCEACGYDLRGSDTEGRCPECGKAVEESLNPRHRQASEWERTPHWWRVNLVLRQMWMLIRRPQTLFRHIPLLSEHEAARRWLGLMIVLVGLLGYGLVAGIRLAFWLNEKLNPRTGLEAANLTLANWQFYALGVGFGALWIALGLMMVGIETAGIATIGYFRQRPVDLAAASKVTGYASTLLLFWIVVGSLQIMGLTLYVISDTAVFVLRHWGERWNALITVGSMAVAQIGGLLWFELVVYRGLAAIQYSNR